MVNMNVRRMTMLPVEEMRKISQMVGLEDDTADAPESPAPEGDAPPELDILRPLRTPSKSRLFPIPRSPSDWLRVNREKDSLLEMKSQSKSNYITFIIHVY